MSSEPIKGKQEVSPGRVQILRRAELKRKSGASPGGSKGFLRSSRK